MIFLCPCDGYFANSSHFFLDLIAPFQGIEHNPETRRSLNKYLVQMSPLFTKPMLLQ